MSLSLDGTTGISATGNIISSGGIISATGNIYGGNIIGTIAPSAITVSGNATVGNLLTAGLISATGNVSGNYFVGNGAALTGLSASKIFNGTSEANIGASGGNANITIGGTSNVVVVATTGIYTTGLSSVSGNITGGNLLTGGLISATGNVSGNYFVGNGAALTGLSASKIFNGTSEANIGTSGGNANITIGGTSNVVVVATTGALVTGIVSASGNVTGGNINTAGQLVSTIATGTAPLAITSTTIVPNLYVARANVSDYDVVTTATTGTYYLGLWSAVTGNLTNSANTAFSVNAATGALQSTIMSATGNITGANLIINGTAAAGSGVLIVSGNIQTSTANATANIGNASNYFNRLFAQATTALYADLAEVYRSDAQYPPGTVLVFGGSQEVTMSTVGHDNKIAGIVSTHPAHVMNSGLQSEFTVEVGLIGRVPCRVIGPIEAGDRVVSSNRAGVAERLDMSKYQPGVIIGKALESYSSTDVGTIEVVVGRL